MIRAYAMYPPRRFQWLSVTSINPLDLLGLPQVIPDVDDRHVRVRFHVIDELIEARPGIHLVVSRRHEFRIDRVLVRRDDQNIGNSARGQPVTPRLEDLPVLFRAARA